MNKQDIYLMLINKALNARKFSYAPYSKFSVGAAILTVSDRIFTGCNIESAAYSICNCAERTAFFKAVSEGVYEFKMIAVVGGKTNESIKDFCTPCGVCRQVMQEFCDPEKFEIILSNNQEIKVFTLSDLLPWGFSLC